MPDSRILTFADVNTSNVPPKLQNDPIWRKCIELACNSKGYTQRYGAVLISPTGRILGEDWNRARPAEKSFPFPSSFMQHAEVGAIGKAISHFAETTGFRFRSEELLQYSAKKLCGSTLYVAGFFVQDLKPLILRRKITNTCCGCTKWYARFGILGAFPHAELGWAVISGKQAYTNALQNYRIIKKRRISKEQLRREISI